MANNLSEKVTDHNLEKLLSGGKKRKKEGFDPTWMYLSYPYNSYVKGVQPNFCEKPNFEIAGDQKKEDP